MTSRPQPLNELKPGRTAMVYNDTTDSFHANGLLFTRAVTMLGIGNVDQAIRALEHLQTKLLSQQEERSRELLLPRVTTILTDLLILRVKRRSTQSQLPKYASMKGEQQ